ncbi:phage tail tube protein [Snodgrassella gandavensis]|uniref:phage tail tube protein n=1 Tax=Snodgrassella gandavensis TaxID=2946698 RepID=UPI001EF48B63|nr:phage tail tube protein [Snodgrassella gandavensis]
MAKAQGQPAIKKSAKRGMSFNSRTYFYDLPETPTKVISELTNTKPAIATSVGHGLKTGDAVWVESVENEAINGYYLVSVSNEDSFALMTLDGEDIGTVTDAKFTTVKRYSFCDATSVKIAAIKTKTIDATTICDEGAVTELEKEPGTISLSGLWVPDKEVQDFLEEMAEELETIFFSLKPKGSKYMRGYQVKITSLDWDGKSGDKWQFSIELQINGRSRKLDMTTGAK